jgi:hypothetical protein
VNQNKYALPEKIGARYFDPHGLSHSLVIDPNDKTWRKEMASILLSSGLVYVCPSRGMIRAKSIKAWS